MNAAQFTLAPSQCITHQRQRLDSAWARLLLMPPLLFFIFFLSRSYCFSFCFCPSHVVVRHPRCLGRFRRDPDNPDGTPTVTPALPSSIVVLERGENASLSFLCLFFFIYLLLMDKAWEYSRYAPLMVTSGATWFCGEVCLRESRLLSSPNARVRFLYNFSVRGLRLRPRYLGEIGERGVKKG